MAAEIETIIEAYESGDMDKDSFYESLKENAQWFEDELSKAIENRQKAKQAKRELEEKLENVTELEGLKQSFDTQIKELTDSVSVNKVEQKLLVSEIEKYAEGKAVNPEQIPKLMDLNSFLYEDDNFISPVLDNDGNRISSVSLKEAVNTFLDRDENENLILANIKTDGLGSSFRFIAKRNNTNRRGFNRNVDKEIVKKAERAGLSVPDYLEISEIRKKKVGK